jgi:hypothetical protein
LTNAGRLACATDVEAYILEGGIDAWKKAGMPVEQNRSQPIEIMRQVQIVVGFVSAVGAALALAVHPWFALISLLTGGGLLFAGLTGFCGLALVLAKMPWNKTSACHSTACCTPDSK